MSGPERLLAGRYRLHDLVGSGGMGEVWRATDEVLGRTVAVKVVRPELLAQPGFADRFRVEARTLATIRHRGVVTVHDYQHGDAGAFLVMEYVDGESLAAVLRREGRLDPAATMVLVAEVAEALQAAHDRGVVHRDIKPANLLVGTDGAPVLTDFGIARVVDATSLTMPGTVIGTPAYLAPEQLLGQPATALSDIYSLGVVGYECLTGRRPFDGEYSYDAATTRMHEPPPQLPDDIPRAAAAVIEGALAGEPGKRWRSAADMAARARHAAQVIGADTQTTLRRFVPGRAAPPGRQAPPAPQVPPARPASLQAGSPSSQVAAAPAAPLPPTRVDSQLAGSVVRGPDGPVSPSHAAPPPPPPPVAPWAGPPRPVTVTVAAVLFLVTAVSMLLVAVVTLAVLERAVAVVQEAAGQGWAGVVGLVGLVTSIGVGLAGLGYLAVAAKTARGRPGARGWAFALAVPLLCCCLPAWSALGAGDGGPDGRAQVVADRVAATLPAWYQQVTGVWVVSGALCLLVALVLVILPSAGRYFRPPPVVVYYPYQPPR